MRSTQYIGLNNMAREWLQEYTRLVKTEIVCPHCGGTIPNGVRQAKSPSGNNIMGMCGEQIPLMKYTIQDGNEVYEVEDTVIWSSGPMIFTCLEMDGIKFFCWTESELEEYTR